MACGFKRLSEVGVRRVPMFFLWRTPPAEGIALQGRLGLWRAFQQQGCNYAGVQVWVWVAWG